MASGPIFSVRRLIIFLSAIIAMAPFHPAQGQTADAAKKGISAIPSLKGIAVQDLKAVGKSFTMKLGKRKIAAIAFATGTKTKPVWNVGIYPAKLDLKKLYSRNADRVLGDIALKYPALIISGGTSKTKFTALPKAVQNGIKKVFGPKVKEVTYPAGVNFSFVMDVARTPAVSSLKPMLDISDKTAAAAGTMGADLIRYLAEGKRTTVKSDLAKVALTAVLNGAGKDKLFESFHTGPLVVTYKGGKDSKVTRSIRTQITTALGDDKKKPVYSFNATVKIDPKAKSADKKHITLVGPLTPAPKKVFEFADLKVRRLALDAAVMGNERLVVAFTGESDKKQPFTLNATIEEKRGGDNLTIEETFPDDPTVKDVIGYARPGLDNIPFKNLKRAGDVITGTVRLTGQDMPVLAFKVDPDGDERHLAIVPKKFHIGAWIPGIKGSALVGANIPGAVLMVVPDGGGDDTPLKELPKIVADRIVKVVGRDVIRENKNKLPIDDGLNLYLRIDVSKSFALSTILGGIGIKEKSLALVGSVSPLVFGTLPDKISAAPKGNDNVIEETLKSFKIATSIAAPRIPGVDKVFQFAGGQLRFRGDAEEDDDAVIAEIENTVDVKLPGKTIPMTAQLDLQKGLDKKAFKVAITGTSEVDWNKAFAIPFLNLKDIGLSAALEVDKDGGHSFTPGLTATIKLGNTEVDPYKGMVNKERAAKNEKELRDKYDEDDAIKAGIELVMEANGITDISLSVAGRIDMDKLPGLNKIPGVRDFAFEDYTISKEAVHGKLIWKKLKYKGAFALVKLEDGYTAFLRVHDLDLETILGKLKKPLDMLKHLTFPRAVLAFSAKDITGLTVGDLPDAAQEIFADIVDGDNDVPVWDGVTLVGAFGEKDLSDDLHRIIAEDLGIYDVIEGDLVVAGNIGGVFSGNPMVGLYADLPTYKFPKGQPWARIVNLDKTKANFFIRADADDTMINVGVGGGMEVTIPHLDDPKEEDTIAFIGEAYASSDLVSLAGSVKVAGRIDGKWREPFGLKNVTYENPSILIGADTEGSVEFGIGTTMEFAARNKQILRFASDFIVNINFSTTIPLPKKLGFRLQAKKLSEIARLEVADSAFRGVMTGPMAKFIVSRLKKPEAREFAAYLQKHLKKRSLLDILQVDKLPIPYIEYQDLDIYFATPGATIPGREDTLEGVGFVSAGKMFLGIMGKKTPLSEVDNRLTLQDGLRIHTKFPKRDLGPIKLHDAEVDVTANIQSVPRFFIHGDATLFGADQTLKIELSKNRLGFKALLDLGPLLLVDMDAQTVGDNLYKAKAFEAKIKGAAIAGLAFTETTARFDGRSGLEFTSTSEIPIGLPLPPVGVLGKTGATAEVKVNDRTGHRLYDIAFAVDTLGLGGAVGFKFEGTPTSMDIAYGARDKDGANRHPCIPFSGNTHLSQGDLAAFGKRAAKGPLPPEAFRELVNFKADIELPSLSGAKDCGSRVLGVAKDIADKARKAAELAAKKAFEETEKLRKAAQLAAKKAFEETERLRKAAEKAVRVAAEKAAKAAKKEAERAAKAARGEIKRATLEATSLFGVDDMTSAVDVGVGSMTRIADFGVDRFKQEMSKAVDLLDIFGDVNLFRGKSACAGASRPKAADWLVMKLHDGRHNDKNLCLEIEDCKDNRLQNIRWAKCTGAWNQAWTLEDRGEIRNYKGGCVGAFSTTHGASVKLERCKGGNAHGLLHSVLDLDGRVHLRNRNWEGNGCLQIGDDNEAVLGDCKGFDRGDAPRIVWYSYRANKVWNYKPSQQWIKRVGLSNEIFDPDFYAKDNPDVARHSEFNAGERHNSMELLHRDMARHWILHGMSEARQGAPGFDIKTYKKRAKDLPDWTTMTMYKNWDLTGRKEFHRGRTDRDPRPEGWTPPALKLKGRDNWAFTKSNLVNLGGLCVDEASGKLTAGGQVIVSGCGAGDRQNWSHNKRGQIVSSNKYYCLDVDSGTARDKEPIIIWGCRGSGAELQRQRWRLANYGAIQHIDSGLCLDSTKDGNSGGKLVLSPCSDTFTQIWKARTETGVADPVFRNVYMATNDNNFCLDAWPNHTAPVGSRSCINHANLRFTFWSDKTIRHDPKDLCMNVQRGGANGAPLVVANCENHPDQRWDVRWSGGKVPSGIEPNKRFQIVHRASGRCLDLSNGTGGGRAVTRNCVGSSNADTWPASQTWRAAQRPPAAQRPSAAQRPPRALREKEAFKLAQLVNGGDRECADEDSGKLTRGGQVIMWGCKGGGSDRKRQLWTHNRRGQVVSTNNLCLDVASGKARIDEPIIIWACNRSGASLERQQWGLAAGGRLRHMDSGLCLDATNYGKRRGKLVLNKCSAALTQKWAAR